MRENSVFPIQVSLELLLFLPCCYCYCAYIYTLLTSMPRLLPASGMVANTGVSQPYLIYRKLKGRSLPHPDP